MGLKCSVLGHRFDEPGLVHEREPRGDEVITIRRKVMVCTLCGEQRVLAENKEITKSKPGSEADNTHDGDDSTVNDSDSTHERDDRNDTIEETGDDTIGKTDGTIEKTGDDTIGKTDETIEKTGDDTIEKTDETIEKTDDGGVETNEINDEAGKRDDIGTGEQSGAGASVVDGTASEETGIGGIDVVHEQGVAVDSTESSVSAQEDDGIVLSDDEDGRGYGEWPDKSDETGADDQWEPDVLRGSSVSTDTGNHTISTPIDTETNTGEIITDEASNGKTRTETKTESETDEQTIQSFCCPSCGFTVAAPDSPFRSGDSCPKCREEYLSVKR